MEFKMTDQRVLQKAVKMIYPPREIAEKIKQLEKHQLAFNKTLDTSFETDHLARAEKLKDISTQTFFKDRNITAIRATENWGTFVHGVPITQTLLLHNRLLVDLKPIRRGQYFVEFGVSFDQFWTLARLGYLRINLMEMDSATGTGKSSKSFARYCELGDSLGELLFDDDVFPNFYIVSLCRQPIFDAMTGDRDALTKKAIESREFFREPVSKFQEFCLRNKNHPLEIRARYRGGAPILEKIAWNWAYFSCADKTLLDISNIPCFSDVENDRGQAKLRDPEIFALFFESMLGWHTKATAPLTGAYGGTLNSDANMAYQWYDLIANVCA